MSRLTRIVALVLVLSVVVAVAVQKWKDPEVATLDQAARAGAPGRFVTLSNGVTHYEVAGPDTGRVIVLVHGFSVPGYIWDSTSHALGAAGYRVVRYDLFGRGWSDRPDAAYDGAMYDAQLDELLDSLHIVGPVDLAGLSYGGYVVAHYAANHPERVRTLTLVDPAVDGVPLPGLLGVPVLGEWIWQVTVVPTMADGQLSDFLHPERYPTWVEQYREQMRYRGFGRALLRTARAGAQVDYKALYGDVARANIPVLLIWGRQDQTVTIDRAVVVTENVPTAQFFPVDSAGHLPHMEQASLVHARWQEFLTAHPSAPTAAQPTSAPAAER